MKSISWTEAFLILRGWRDAKTLIFIHEIIGEDEQGNPVGSGPSGYIEDVDSASGIIKSSSGMELDLLGASFRYTDERDSPFLGSISFSALLEVVTRDDDLYTVSATGVE
jgi:hypothetical protein